MKLYLVQHGEACTKEVDPDRPLTKQGREDIERLAAFLKQVGIQVSRVIHSGKLRAMQTADGLAKIIAAGSELEVSGCINPNDEASVFSKQIDAWSDDVLVVGHLPFMANLVSYLAVEEQSKLAVAYRPGTIVCLERTNTAQWQINWMLRPSLLSSWAGRRSCSARK